MKKILFFLLLPLSLLGQGTKISDMTSATSLTGSEYVPIVQTTNKKATVSLLRGWSSIGTAAQLLRVNGSANGLEFFTPTWLTNPLTTTGDIIYSSSGTTGARLGIGGAGTFLRSDGSIPAWSTLTIPNTISALSIPVINTANVLTSVTPAAGQSVRINAGGTAWEAYTPGGGGSTWGSITGTLSDQTDLQATLDLKLNKVGDTYTTTTGDGLALTSSTVTSGNLVHLTNTGTTAASNTKTVLRVASSGANATSTQTTYGGYFSNINTGTSSTNVAGFFTASGASTNYAILTGAGNLRFEGTASMTLGTTGNSALTIQGSGGGVIANFLQVFSSTSALNIYQAAGSSASGTIFRGATASVTVGTHTALQLSNLSWAVSSGSGTFIGHGLKHTINTTGTFSGTHIGYDYDPTLTSTTGLTNLSFRATSGNMLLPASSYINFSTTSGSSGYGFRDNSGVVQIKNSGDDWTFPSIVNATSTNGQYLQRVLTGTTSATAYSEIVLTSSQISDGQACTLEILWTIKDTTANTSAGGITYSTWSKASGTLVKAGDTALTNNDNAAGSFTVGTSDSSGNIQVDITSAGANNFEYTAHVKIIKTN